jgi:hypothetical protein
MGIPGSRAAVAAALLAGVLLAAAPAVAGPSARSAGAALVGAAAAEPLGTAASAPSVRLAVALVPERLGAGTTIEFSFNVTTPDGRVPPPLTAIDLRYPANLGLATSGLGLASCYPATLEALGPEGCPADSLMGHGNALVEIPIGAEPVREHGYLTCWMGPFEHGHLSLLFYANGETPVYAQLIFPGLILEASAPFGGRLDTRIPIIPSVPEGPNASVVRMSATIGPQHITYYAHVRGHVVAYTPRGLLLPPRCPRGGFPFAATFTFLGASRAHARASVPCPASRS